MNILVTGNMGYVGSALIPHLRNSGAHPLSLTGLDTGFFSGALTSTEPLPETFLDKQIFQDVRDITVEHLNGYDAIVHLAAVSNDPIGHTFGEATHEINYQATVNVAEMAKKAGVSKFIFASSCSVYGAAPGQLVGENGELNPQTDYAISKVNAEKQLMSLADASFQTTSLRFATACGFSPRLRLDLVVNDFVATALTQKEILLKSKGTAWRPFIDVKDMAKAIEWALFRDGEVSQVLNVGSDAMNFTIKNLADKVSDILNIGEVNFADGVVEDKRSYQVDFTTFKNSAPKHQPAEKLEDTVLGLFNGLDAVRFTDGNFRTGILIRLNHLNKLLEQNKISNTLRARNDR